MSLIPERYMTIDNWTLDIAYQYSIVDDLLALILIVFIFIVNRAAHILLIPHKCWDILATCTCPQFWPQ